MLDSRSRLAVYAEGVLTEDAGKMATGVLRYGPHEVVAVVDSRYAGQSVEGVLGHWIPDDRRTIPIVGTVLEAKRMGAEVLVLGIAVVGGQIPIEVYAHLDEAVQAGLSIVNGLHDRLSDRYPVLAQGQFVWDVRTEPQGLRSGSGAACRLDNRRVLLVGTDMGVGKMTTGLEIYRAGLARGISAGFVATGQIGITIMGAGIPLDAIRVDFASGAVEREVLGHGDKDLVIVEGQGSLLHPASSATLPLMRGSCPTDLILCHRAGMARLRRAPEIAVPPLRQVVGLYERLANVWPPDACRVRAVSLNTCDFTETQAREHIDAVSHETGLPCFDPVRFGVDGLLDALLGELR